MRKQRNLLTIGAIAATVALVATGCSPRTGDTGDDVQASPGITDDSILFGGSFPLSGPLLPFGAGQLGGINAFFEATNAVGGVEMADGATREIDFTYYDDAYDPARIVQNFNRLADQDGMFGFVGAFGTASNLAVQPIAEELEIPQVFVASGASVFSSDRESHPWTLGWQPTYENEGVAYGEYLVSLDEPITLAFLGQNDDQGAAFRAGLEDAIDGSDVTLVAAATYERTDTTLDSQISQLASSGADAFMAAVAFPNLMVPALKKMQELQWAPITYLPVVASGVDSVVVPSGAADYIPDLLTGAFVKLPCAPGAEDDPEVQEYLEDIAEYSPDADPCIPNTVFGYATGATVVRALEIMKAPTRKAFMDAILALRTDDIPMLQDGLSVDGSDTGQPPVSALILQRFETDTWVAAE